MMYIRSVSRRLSPARIFSPSQSPILLFVAAALILLFVFWRIRPGMPDLWGLILGGILAVLCGVILLHARFLLQAHSEHMESERRFQQIAENIQEVFWMVDTTTKKLIYVNSAYRTMTDSRCRNVEEDISGYEHLIHVEDRANVIARLKSGAGTGQFDERFRITTSSGEVRWIWLRGFPVRDATGKLHRLVGTAQNITAQKLAEEQVTSNLALAESAWRQADALRRATLAMTQDLRMDYVLDTLLQSLADLIPFECARVLLQEAESRLFVARQMVSQQDTLCEPAYPLTLDAANVPLLRQVLIEQRSILIPETAQEKQWRKLPGNSDTRSWLCVPLVASGQVLGVLSVGHTQPNRFTPEHLRRAQLLAIPAAAAIQNARLYERAEIYGAELEKRLATLHRTETALAQSEEGRRICEDKFQKVFRASPIPFSITTLRDGRFVDVNRAFERRYGYHRAELVGRTVCEVMLWVHAAERAMMVEQLERGEPVRNVITQFRTKTGDIKLTAYSADKINFDGQACILAVSEEIPEVSVS
jgi:PAS domain S-box-containing protein